MNETDERKIAEQAAYEALLQCEMNVLAAKTRLSVAAKLKNKAVKEMKIARAEWMKFHEQNEANLERIV